ncbi:MAG: SufB/SufD family protein [Acidimicrobiales bacterium]
MVRHRRWGPSAAPTVAAGSARGEVAVLPTFTADAAAGLAGPEWLRRRRSAAFEDFAAMPLPSEKEEVWRYSPIDRLDLDTYRPEAAAPPAGGDGESGSRAFADGLAADLADRSALVLGRGGWPVAADRHRLVAGLRVGGADLADGLLGRVLGAGDALVRLNDAFHPEPVVVDVAPGTRVPAPVVIVHWCAGAVGDGPAPAAFPRTLVRVGRGAAASVVEVVAGAPAGERALVVPVTELSVDDGGRLDHVALQVLGEGAWHIGRIAATAGRDAHLAVFTVGLGGAYGRARTDAAATGAGSSTELRSAYLGTGSQVHDVRTLQDHAGPHTTSDLLCKGAVAGASRSVYSGLIRVRRGAVRTNAFQTNHNLVLDQRAHADSVPNLDIAENDVRCSHASTVGPVDDDQRYYLESRGIPPERAERLIVLGFFDDIVDRSPVPAVVGRLRREVAVRLAGALGLDRRQAVEAMDAMRAGGG